MKIRIDKNKLIFRINPEDIVRLQEKQLCEIFFFVGKAKYVFQIQATDTQTRTEIRNNGLHIIFLVAIEELSLWLSEGAEATIQTSIRNADNSETLLRIEKDFKHFLRT